eukprot:Unigene9388_Nuclearia_a/m.28662 Unigene9388_Nuclearia_a/g.28662  ORF Unigene9388_Nuclearia_a/g.28662 Unigene9388_Nuclearia_a/m.28662 type:complete len:379 (+) Unigene9388_Nuclearia_a:76-1212(+)
MDALAALKAELDAKRKAVTELAGERKYVKRSELEAAREAKYLQEQREADAKRQVRKTRGSGSESEELLPLRREGSVDASAKSEDEEQGRASMISSKEVVKRLRRRGEPIRLFGESDAQRYERLRELERAIPDESLAQQNTFMANIKTMDRKLDLDALQRKAEGEGSGDKAAKQSDLLLPADDRPVTVELYQRDKEKIYHLMNNYWAKLLMEWEADLDARPEDVKRSTSGKVEYVTMVQSKEYLKPFFKLLRRKQLADDLLLHLTRIVEYMQKREYVLAGDVYYLLSIGNAPWPIGVTMVGIHERSAREKIFSNQVAHVLNDEKTRKWIQSLKRLMTFCQNKYLPEDLAKTVGWVRTSGTTPGAPAPASVAVGAAADNK